MYVAIDDEWASTRLDTTWYRGTVTTSRPAGPGQEPKIAHSATLRPPLYSGPFFHVQEVKSTSCDRLRHQPTLSIQHAMPMIQMVTNPVPHNANFVSPREEEE